MEDNSDFFDTGKLIKKNNRILKTLKCRHCGNEINRNKRDKIRKYCGCTQKTYHQLYTIWKGMNNRCKANNIYGLKGRVVYDKWKNWNTFRRWAITNGWIECKRLSIDRINNDGDYKPTNCKIIPLSENISKAHKRGGDTMSNEKITMDEASEICEAYSTGLFTQREIAKYHKVHQQTISKIIRSVLC
jgi:hypothetical protein